MMDKGIININELHYKKRDRLASLYAFCRKNYESSRAGSSDLDDSTASFYDGMCTAFRKIFGDVFCADAVRTPEERIDSTGKEAMDFKYDDTQSDLRYRPEEWITVAEDEIARRLAAVDRRTFGTCPLPPGKAISLVTPMINEPSFRFSIAYDGDKPYILYSSGQPFTEGLMTGLSGMLAPYGYILTGTFVRNFLGLPKFIAQFQQVEL